LFVLSEEVLKIVVDKVIKRVDVLFDESFGFEEHEKEEPFVFRCLDWIRKSEYFVDLLRIRPVSDFFRCSHCTRGIT